MHKPTSRRALLAAATAAVATACSPRTSRSPEMSGSTSAPTTEASAPEATRRPVPAARSDRDRASDLLGRMTLDQKIGQLFVLSVYGHSATAPGPADAAANRKKYGVGSAAELVARYHLGGIMYTEWAHNIRDPRQIAALSNGIQKAALDGSTEVLLDG